MSSPSPGAAEQRAFALLGDPVSHSLSPAIHEAAFRALGIPARYSAVRVAAGDLPEALGRWADRGGGNVTLPHKERAAGLLERATGTVTTTRACNCFWRDGEGRLAGDNTDVGGFLAAVDEMPGARGLEGAAVLLLGAGGGAAAVLEGCLRRGARRVDLLNRTVARARRRAARRRAAGAGASRTEVRVLEAGEDAEGSYDLVVNATRLGLSPSDPLPVRLAGRELGAAFDLVYAPGGTAWSRRAEELGIPAADGLGMLVHQAALSLRRWIEDVDPPLERMREAARSAAAARARGRGEE